MYLQRWCLLGYGACSLQVSHELSAIIGFDTKKCSATTVRSQLASAQGDDYALSVNIPQDTASGSSKSIFMQISAPSGVEWVGIGQGSQMAGANMMLVYAASSSNVTVSPRSSSGESQPDFDSSAQVTVLEGSGVNSDGSFVANIRCDTCLSWSGGSMDPTDTSSDWIWAYKSGSALDSEDTSENLDMHSSMGSFHLNLKEGTGGSSQNPFVAAAAASGSPSASASATGTGAQPSATGGVSAPAATNAPHYGGSSTSGGNVDSIRTAHAVIMSLIFLVMFPLAALTLYLPYEQRVRYVHAPLQVLSLILLIVGLATGVVLGNKVDELDGYHQVIGYIVVAALVLFQPALGIYQHMHYRKTGGRSPMGIIHRWLGRSVIILGVINGGLGFMQSGPVGSDDVPSYSVVVYGIVAAVVFLIYACVVLASIFRARRKASTQFPEKDYSRRGYEMQSSPNPNQYNTSRFNSDRGRTGYQYR